MWYFPIIFVAALTIILTIVTTGKYTKISKEITNNTISKLDQEKLTEILINDFPRTLIPMQNFSNISANFILKFIIFLLVAIILHLTDKVFIASIYSTLYLSLEGLKYFSRQKDFKIISRSFIVDQSTRKVFRLIKSGYNSIFYFTIILVICIFEVYTLNA